MWRAAHHVPSVFPVANLVVLCCFPLIHRFFHVLPYFRPPGEQQDCRSGNGTIGCKRVSKPNSCVAFIILRCGLEPVPFHDNQLANQGASLLRSFCGLREFWTCSPTPNLLVQRVTLKPCLARFHRHCRCWNRFQDWYDERPGPFSPEVKGAIRWLPAEDLLLFGRRDRDAALHERGPRFSVDPSYGLCVQLPCNFA